MNPFLLIQRSPIKRSRRKPRPGDDPEYLAWIRTLPCLICVKADWEWTGRQFQTVQNSPTEAAHVGLRGLSQKCPDRQTLPLCGVEHHREGPESHHKLGKRFWSRHGLNRDALIQQCNERYDRECAA